MAPQQTRDIEKMLLPRVYWDAIPDVTRHLNYVVLLLSHRRRR